VCNFFAFPCQDPFSKEKRDTEQYFNLNERFNLFQANNFITSVKIKSIDNLYQFQLMEMNSISGKISD